MRGEPPNKFLRNLGRYLLEIGRDRKWLSEVSGVNHNTINAIFAHNRFPKLDVAHQIAESLGLSIDYLMSGDDSTINMSKDMKEIVDLLEVCTFDELREAKAALQMWFILRSQVKR